MYPVYWTILPQDSESQYRVLRYIVCVCGRVCVLVTQLCPILCNPLDCSPPGSLVHGDSPGKNTGVGCHFLLQGIFITQGSNLRLLCPLHWQVDSWPLAPPGKPDPPGGLMKIFQKYWLDVIEITPSIHTISVHTGPSAQDMTLVFLIYLMHIKVCAKWHIRIRRKGLLFRSSQIHWGEKLTHLQ